jgi:hypothetical protein
MPPVAPSCVSIEKFTADGRAVAYPVGENGVDDIWIQPIDGCQGRQMTDFNSEQILAKYI